MKGMIVKSNIGGKLNLLEIAVPNSIVDVTVNITRYDGPFWTVGGLKMPEGIHITWDGGNLIVGDEIEIEIAEIAQATPHVHAEKHSSLKKSMETMAKDENDAILWEQKMDRYQRLKAILDDEYKNDAYRRLEE